MQKKVKDSTQITSNLYTSFNRNTESLIMDIQLYNGDDIEKLYNGIPEFSEFNKMVTLVRNKGINIKEKSGIEAKITQKVDLKRSKTRLWWIRLGGLTKHNLYIKLKKAIKNSDFYKNRLPKKKWPDWTKPEIIMTFYRYEDDSFDFCLESKVIDELNLEMIENGNEDDDIEEFDEDVDIEDDEDKKINDLKETLLEKIESLQEQEPVPLKLVFDSFGKKEGTYLGNKHHIFYQSKSNFGVKSNKILNNNNDIFIIFLYQSNDNILVAIPYWLFKNEIETSKIGWGVDEKNKDRYSVTINISNTTWGGNYIEEKKYRIRIQQKPKLGELEPEFDIEEDGEFSTENDFPSYNFSEKKRFDHHIDENLDKYISLLKKRKQIIFYGPPGTGKTYFAQVIAHYIAKQRYEIVQFHPSYSYEDFVECIEIVPTKNEKSVFYKPTKKIFRELCNESLNQKDEYVVLIIDEINRGDLARIFGELILGLESNYRGIEIKTSLSKTLGNLIIPDNLLIIGTMNSVDRSIAMIDYALRRRFLFIHIKPDKKILNEWLIKNNSTDIDKIVSLFENLNKKIEADHQNLGKEYQIGHTYFFVKNKEELRENWDFMIKPIIKEYLNYNPNELAEYKFSKLCNIPKDEDGSKDDNESIS